MNVLYLVAHDLGKELGCYGSSFRTPALDQFAREGVRFDEAYCSSPCCSPSRGCAMTGMSAHNNGLAGLANPGWDWSLPESVQTIVDDFNTGGYETIHAGMQHERQDKEKNRYQRYLPGGGYVEEAVDSAIAYLEARPEDAPPFYLNIGTNEVHSGQWELEKFDRHTDRFHLYKTVPPEEVRLPDYMPDFPQLRREWGAFQGCVEYWDSQIGRLLAAIDHLGYRDNTLVVITTDHGVLTHRGKGTAYKEGLEIALLARLPGGATAASSNALIGNIDYLPTLLEACDLPIRSEVQGRSFLPQLKGASDSANEAIFIERNFHADWDPIRVIRTSEYALLENYDPPKLLCHLPHEVKELKDSYKRWFDELWPPMTKLRPRLELFDRRKDPREMQNVAEDPAYAGILQNLRDQLHQWMERTQDPLLEAIEPESFKAVLYSRFL